MSILRTYNVQNPDSASVNVELSADGGVRVAGLSQLNRTGKTSWNKGISKKKRHRLNKEKDQQKSVYWKSPS